MMADSAAVGNGDSGVVSSNDDPSRVVEGKDSEAETQPPLKNAADLAGESTEHALQESGDTTEASGHDGLHQVHASCESKGSDDQMNIGENEVARVNKDAYVKPIDDPLDKASKYLAKHGILQLFQVLTAGIAYNRPKDPIQYLISEVQEIRDLDRLRKGVIKKPENSSGKT